MTSPRTTTVVVQRVTDGTVAATSSSDVVVVEEPLEIRVAGDVFAMTLRTPGHDRELAAGLLFAEGLIHSSDDLSGMTHCGRMGSEGFGNTLEVTPAPGVTISLDESTSRRGTMLTSACGLCGRQSIDGLLATRKPLAVEYTVSATVISACVRAMRDTQPLFDTTGGCHCASLFTHLGEHVATCEDVGRHNAVDKIVGTMLFAKRLPYPNGILTLSGRAGFEVIQKAHAAGIAIVASVGAPSGLAVDLARRANITLTGFARGENMVIYSASERVTGVGLATTTVDVLPAKTPFYAKVSAGHGRFNG
jgi:FdhD protein